MSGIYIKGMDMPSCCVVCPFVGEKLGWCIVSGEFQEDAYRPQTCPLIPIPPHGRLIDADKIPERFAEVRDLAPTIIPADKEAVDT